MWRHREWVIQFDRSKLYHTVYYDGYMPMYTWKQVAVHLGYDDIAEYIKFLRDNYPSLRVRILWTVDGTMSGLSIDFLDENDAIRLAEYCNTVESERTAKA